MRSMVQQGWFHKRTMLQTEPQAWMRRYHDTLKTALRHAHTVSGEYDTFSPAAQRMLRPIMSRLARTLLRSVHRLVVQKEVRAAVADQARDEYEEIERVWDDALPTPWESGRVYHRDNRRWWYRDA
jgi:hypothetical protein